ncbi:hypothetical protein [Deinococcus sp. ME38]|uniref:hypothetical protein n=1 Tax=Deinococcus sp. ME38 TaxID=3400344 RepID=UPI003B5A35C2
MNQPSLPKTINDTAVRIRELEDALTGLAQDAPETSEIIRELECSLRPHATALRALANR